MVESPPLLDGRNADLAVLGPTKNAGVSKDAKAEDIQTGEEEVQGDRSRQDPAPEGPAGHKLEEVREAQA